MKLLMVPWADGAPRRTILLVEDDAICRIEFAEKLRAYGYEVLEATDVTEAIDLLEKHHREIELVITDMALPKISGFSLITNIQARWPKIPIIMVSGYLSENHGQAILGIDVLEKPLRPSALIAIVQRLVPQPEDS